ncbi:MAG TPA: TetR/AcrR family transcriptional regulator [Jatrophihabitans sp.]|nr:TetR/AcrR family transcriptional regulator [Jatrophihabitans sp.]
MKAKADGRSARWDAHRLARRAELVELTAACVEQQGAEVGMDQIAAFAGTSKAVFYRHFTDKADLYRSVGQQLAGTLADQLAAAMAKQREPRAMIRAGIDAFLAVLDRNPQVYRFVVRNPVVQRAGDDPVADYIGRIAARLDELIGLLPAPEPALRRPWGTAIVGLVKAAGDWWLEHPAELSRPELAESLTRLLWGEAGGLRDVLAAAERPSRTADSRTADSRTAD